MIHAFDRAVGWIVEKPLITLLLLATITGFAIVGYIDPQLVTGMFQEASEAESAGDSAAEVFETPPDVDPVNLADAHAIIVVESDDFFTPHGVEAMRAVVEGLESRDHIDRVLWLDRVPILNIFGLPEPLLPSSHASEERFKKAKEKALAHPLVGGQLLSRDGRTLLMLVNFDMLFVEVDEDCTTGLRQAVEDIVRDHEGQYRFVVTGRVPMYIAAMQSHSSNQWRYQLIGYGMIAIMSLILFRGLSAVLIVAIAPSLGVFWTLGILHFFDLQDNPFNDVVLPVLLSLVGLTDGVHLMVQIRRYRSEGDSGRVAARRGLREVGLACALTSLTTAIGFGSLSLAHHEIVKEFGWSCVIGVMLTFIAVIASIPLACTTWLGRRVHVGHERGLIDRHMGRIGAIVEFVLARQRRMAVIGIGVTALLVGISLTLRPDERVASSLPSRSEAARGMSLMDRALGGLEFAYVDIHWNRDVDTQSPEVLQVIGQVDELLGREELIGSPLSIRNLLDSLPGDGDANDRMSLLELMPPPLKRAFFTPEYRSAKVSFRVQDLGIATYGPVFDRVNAGLSEIATKHPGFVLSLSGSAVWRWENLYQIVQDLTASLGTAMIIIFVVLSVVYRSLRMGLISILPNVFPLAVTGSFLALTGQSLEMVSVCAFTVCLGIAVDDTIHFLTRFEEERARHVDQKEAIRKAFTGVGTALVMTTIVLVAGFSTVVFSDSRDHRIFASMGVLTISSALFGDLVFLPALLARFAPKPKLEPTDEDTEITSTECRATT